MEFLTCDGCRDEYILKYIAQQRCIRHLRWRCQFEILLKHTGKDRSENCLHHSPVQQYVTIHLVTVGFSRRSVSKKEQNSFKGAIVTAR